MIFFKYLKYPAIAEWVALSLGYLENDGVSLRKTLGLAVSIIANTSSAVKKKLNNWRKLQTKSVKRKPKF